MHLIPRPVFRAKGAKVTNDLVEHDIIYLRVPRRRNLRGERSE